MIIYCYIVTKSTSWVAFMCKVNDDVSQSCSWHEFCVWYDSLSPRKMTPCVCQLLEYLLVLLEIWFRPNIYSLYCFDVFLHCRIFFHGLLDHRQRDTNGHVVCHYFVDAEFIIYVNNHVL